MELASQGPADFQTRCKGLEIESSHDWVPRSDVQTVDKLCSTLFKLSMPQFPSLRNRMGGQLQGGLSHQVFWKLNTDWHLNYFINVMVALHRANEWISEWMDKSGTSQLSQDTERGRASKYVTFTGMQEIEIRQTTVRQASCWGWEILSHVPHSTFPTEQCMLGNGSLITIKANMWWMHPECQVPWYFLSNPSK